jgi:hypothetical protein
MGRVLAGAVNWLRGSSAKKKALKFSIIGAGNVGGTLGKGWA